MQPPFLPGCFLSAKQLKAIDQTARRILKQIGIRIPDPETLETLAAAGARVDRRKSRVRFEKDWLDRHLIQAPSRFTLYSRDGNSDVHLGSGHVYFSNGGRVFRILDMATGGYRLTMLRDIAHTAALVHQLEHIHLYIIACQAHDIGPKNYHLNDFYQAFSHTTKHVMGGCDTLEGTKQMVALASLVAGGEDRLKAKPFVSVITNPVSPLTMDTEALRIFKFCCRHGIPVTCAPAPISGATAPASLAGTLVQTHAEALAGVALAQVFEPGAKVLYGAVPSTMDLRNMDYTMGSVEMAMLNAAAVQLARHYRLPIYASGGVTEAKRPDIQAGCEKSISNLMVALNGADLVHLAAGMLDSVNSISYEQYVIDNEIIGMIQRLVKGIRVDQDTLAFDVINKVGPGGNFVLEDHTVEHMLDEFFYPGLGVRCNFDVWEQKGRPSMLSRAVDRVKKILDDGPEGLLAPDLIIRINKAFSDIIPL
ncbi:MAG: trimethylamine methyltransferase family protein [Desulfobacterales bacterium]|uniref:Trimethylamine methyltransferase family protein n=1 Tax=Candidatus Desulfatibia profunda TaxID=2841695 RepID=A0A8J6NQE1_9BACT|nr:trimethylamine methyltransferase family protein [Candidatus Desulfatibia profunda]MBL7178931.1 trimethylamine methyltransferase family protein [Desulfobacterales bacterium]